MGSANEHFILGAVGTDHHPFDRFVEWIDTWQSQNNQCQVFVQRGTTTRVPNVESAQWLEPTELDAMMTRATAIVCHGGPSTIMEARRAGVVPIVIARDPAKGEHVDDHQMRFTKFMADKGAVLSAQSQDALSQHLNAVITGQVDRVVAGSPTATLDRISQVIDDLMEHPAPKLFKAPQLNLWSRKS